MSNGTAKRCILSDCRRPAPCQVVMSQNITWFFPQVFKILQHRDLVARPWFHRTLPFVVMPDGTSLLATDFKFVVVHADPRRLLIRGDHTCCSFLLVGASCPMSRKNQRKWGIAQSMTFRSGGKKLQRSFRPAPQLPFNGCVWTPMHHLRPQETECFGLLDAEVTNAQGGVC